MDIISMFQRLVIIVMITSTILISCHHQTPLITTTSRTPSQTPTVNVHSIETPSSTASTTTVIIDPLSSHRLATIQTPTVSQTPASVDSVDRNSFISTSQPTFLIDNKTGYFDVVWPFKPYQQINYADKKVASSDNVDSVDANRDYNQHDDDHHHPNHNHNQDTDHHTNHEANQYNDHIHDPHHHGHNQDSNHHQNEDNQHHDHPDANSNLDHPDADHYSDALNYDNHDHHQDNHSDHPDSHDYHNQDGHHDNQDHNQDLNDKNQEISNFAFGIKHVVPKNVPKIVVHQSPRKINGDAIRYGFRVNDVPPPPPPPKWTPERTRRPGHGHGVSNIEYQQKNPQTGHVSGYHFNVNHGTDARPQIPQTPAPMPPPPPPAPAYNPPERGRHQLNHKYQNDKHQDAKNYDNENVERPKNVQNFDDENDDYEYDGKYNSVPNKEYDYDYDERPAIRYQKSKSKEHLIRVTPISFQAVINKLSPGMKFIKEYDIWHHHHHIHHDANKDADSFDGDNHDADSVNDDRHPDAEYQHNNPKKKMKQSVRVSKTKVVPMDVDVYEINDPNDNVNDIDEIIDADIVDGTILGDADSDAKADADSDEEEEGNYPDLPELPDLPDLLPDASAGRHLDSYLPSDYESVTDKSYWSSMEGVHWTPIKYRYRRDERLGKESEDQRPKDVHREKNSQRIGRDANKFKRLSHPSFGVSELLDQDYLSEDPYQGDADEGQDKDSMSTDAKIKDLSSDAKNLASTNISDSEDHFKPFFPPKVGVSTNIETLDKNFGCKIIPSIASPPSNETNLLDANKNGTHLLDAITNNAKNESYFTDSPFHNTDLKANRLRSNLDLASVFDDAKYEPETPDVDKERNHLNTDYKLRRLKNDHQSERLINSTDKNDTAKDEANDKKISFSNNNSVRYETPKSERLKHNSILNTDIKAFIYSKTRTPSFSDADPDAKIEDQMFSQSFDELIESRDKISYLPRDPRFMKDFITSPNVLAPKKFVTKHKKSAKTKIYSNNFIVNRYLPRGPSLNKMGNRKPVKNVRNKKYQKKKKKFSELLSVKTRNKYRDEYHNIDDKRPDADTQTKFVTNKMFNFTDGNVNFRYRNISTPTQRPHPKLNTDLNAFIHSNHETPSKTPIVDWNDDNISLSNSVPSEDKNASDADADLKYLNELKHKSFDNHRPRAPPAVIQVFDYAETPRPKDKYRATPSVKSSNSVSYRQSPIFRPSNSVSYQPTPRLRLTDKIRFTDKNIRRPRPTRPIQSVSYQQTPTKMMSTIRTSERPTPTTVVVNVQQNVLPDNIQDIKNSLNIRTSSRRPKMMVIFDKNDDIHNIEGQRSKSRRKSRPKSYQKKLIKNKKKHKQGKYQHLEMVSKRPKYKKIIELPRTPKSVDKDQRYTTTKGPKIDGSKVKSSKYPKKYQISKKGSEIDEKHEEHGLDGHDKDGVHDGHDGHDKSDDHKSSGHRAAKKYDPKEPEEPTFESDKKKEPISFQYNIEIRSRGPQGPIHYNNLDGKDKGKVNLHEGRDKHVDKDLEASKYKKSEHLEEEHWHEKKWEKEDLNENYLNGKGVPYVKGSSGKYKGSSSNNRGRNYKDKGDKSSDKGKKRKKKGKKVEESKVIKEKIPHYARMLNDGASKEDIEEHFKVPSKGFRVDDKFENWVHKDVDLKGSKNMFNKS